MTFLFQSLLAVGLPLIAVPLLIHLINLRRHRRIQWAAMEFLLKARVLPLEANTEKLEICQTLTPKGLSQIMRATKSAAPPRSVNTRFSNTDTQ